MRQDGRAVRFKRQLHLRVHQLAQRDPAIGHQRIGRHAHTERKHQPLQFLKLPLIPGFKALSLLQCRLAPICLVLAAHPKHVWAE